MIRSPRAERRVDEGSLRSNLIPGTQPEPDFVGATASGLRLRVEAKGLEPSNLLTASQALYQLSYAPGTSRHVTSPA
jgi:hypothetical protein